MKKIPYNVIMSLVGTIILLLQCFGVKVDVAYVNEITVAVAGLLVALGVVLPKKQEQTEIQETTDEETIE